MKKKNCWEAKQCGREPGGVNAVEIGICPAASETRADGVNDGRNGGRVCWAIAGTMCRGNVQGTFASKIENCRACDFYQSVQEDLLADGQVRSRQLSRILDLVLEQTVALEHEIEQRERIEDALMQVNKKLNLLSCITRHDVLNQLTILAGYIDIAGGHATDSKQKEIIRKEARSADIIRQHIAFTQAYQDFGVQAPLWQNLRNVIDRSVHAANPGAIAISVNTGTIELFADPLLEKVFFNLLENAAIHGKIVTHITLSARISGEGLLILCEDDGIGIPNREKKNIFNRKFFKNTGFGLFLSREILTITDISICETGEHGKGARFEILVPIGKFRVFQEQMI